MGYVTRLIKKSNYVLNLDPTTNQLLSSKISGSIPGILIDSKNGFTEFRCKYLSTYLIMNYKSFKSGLDVLEWLIENSQVVLRLKDEAELIHEHSTLTEIQDLIHS